MSRKNRPTLVAPSAPVRSMPYGRRPDLKPLDLHRSLQALSAYLDGSCSMRLLPRKHEAHRKSVLAIWGIPLPMGMLVVTLRAQPGGHRLDLDDCLTLVRASGGTDGGWVQALAREHGFPRLSSDLALTAILGFGRECVSEERLFIAPLMPQGTFMEWRDGLLPLLPATQSGPLSEVVGSPELRMSIDLF